MASAEDTTREQHASDPRKLHRVIGLLLANLIILPLLIVVTWNTTPSDGYWTAILTILTAYPTLLIAGFALLYSSFPLRMQLALEIFRSGWRQPAFWAGVMMLALVLLAGFRGLVTPNPGASASLSPNHLQILDDWISPLSIVLLFVGLEITGLLALGFLRLQRPERLAQSTVEMVAGNPNIASSLVGRLTEVLEHESRTNDNDFKCFVVALAQIAAFLHIGSDAAPEHPEDDADEGDNISERGADVTREGPNGNADDVGSILQEIVHLYTLVSSNRDQGLACLGALEIYLKSTDKSRQIHGLVAAISDHQVGDALFSNDHPSAQQVSKILEIGAAVVSRGHKEDLKTLSVLHNQLIEYWVERSLPRDVNDALKESLPSQLRDPRFQLEIVIAKAVSEELRGPVQEVLLALLREAREPKRAGYWYFRAARIGRLLAALAVLVGTSRSRDDFTALVQELKEHLSTLDDEGLKSFHERLAEKLNATALGHEDVQRIVQMLITVANRYKPQTSDASRYNFLKALTPAIHCLIGYDFTAYLRGVSAAMTSTMPYPNIREACGCMTQEHLRTHEWLQSAAVVASLTPAAQTLRAWCGQRNSELPEWVSAKQEFLVDLKDRDSWHFRAGLGADLPPERARAYWRWTMEQLTACFAVLDSMRAVEPQSTGRRLDGNQDSIAHLEVRELPILWYRLVALSLALSVDMHALSRDPEALVLVARFARMLGGFPQGLRAATNDTVVAFARKSVREYLVESPPAAYGDAPAQVVWSILAIRELHRAGFHDKDEIHDEWLEMAVDNFRKTPLSNLGGRLKLLLESDLPRDWSQKFGRVYGEKPGPYEENCEALVDLLVAGNRDMAEGVLQGVAGRGGGPNWHLAFVHTLMDRAWNRKPTVSVMDVLSCDLESNGLWVPARRFEVACDWLVQAVGAGDLRFAQHIIAEVRKDCEEDRKAQDAFGWKLLDAIENHETRVNVVDVLNCDPWLSDIINRKLN